jgi:hypothetical protein
METGRSPFNVRTGFVQNKMEIYGKGYRLLYTEAQL